MRIPATHSWTIFVSFAAFAAIGCGSTRLKEVTFRRQSDAGAVHIGVQSVSPFEEYIDALQPKFTLKAEDALQKAIPLTRLEEITEMRALAASLKIALSQIKVSDAKEMKEAGTVDSVDAAPAATMPNVTPFVIPATEALQLDAGLQYQAAASLFQEVALLSSYVRDAAVSKDQVPYFVRLLVTLLPSARASAYDYYATVSFYEESQAAGQQDYAVHGSRAWEPAVPLTPVEEGQLPRLEEMLRNLGDKLRAADGKEKERDELLHNAATLGDLQRRKAALAIASAVGEQFTGSRSCGRHALTVLPLFSTVRYEASTESIARGRRTDLSFAGSGSVGTVGVGGGLGSSAEDRERDLFRAVNSPFAVARLAENTLQVRLGAVFAGGETGFVTPAQQYYLTALVLVRRAKLTPNVGAKLDTDLLDVVPCPVISYVSDTSVRSVREGRRLSRDNPRPALLAAVRANLESGKGASVEQLTTDILNGDESAFAQHWDGSGVCDTACRRAWTQGVSTLGAYGTTSGRLRVPNRYFKFFSDHAQAGVMDDGKAAILRISDVDASVSAAGMMATLVVGTRGQPGARWVLHPTDVSVDPGGRAARIAFPSISSVCTGSSCEITQATIEWGRPLSRWSSPSQTLWRWQCPFTGTKVSDCLSYAVAKPAADPPAHPSVTIPSPRLVLSPAGGGTFTAYVECTKKKDARGTEVPAPVALTVSGADAVVTGTSASADSTFWKVAGDTTVSIAVSNAVSGSALQVKVRSLDGDGKPDDKTAATAEIVVLPAPAAPTTAKDK